MCIAGRLRSKIGDPPDHAAEWYNRTQDAYQTTIVMHWCMLMGVFKEETNYLTLLNIEGVDSALNMQNLDEATMIALLLNKSELTANKFAKYWNDMVTHRNKYLCHRTMEKGLTYPYLAEAFQTLKAIHTILMEIVVGSKKNADAAHFKPYSYEYIATEDYINLLERSIPRFLK